MEYRHNVGRGCMHIELVHSLSRAEEIVPHWNRLAGDNPFLRWEWISAWWESFSGDGELYILVGHASGGREDDETIIGIAPWYRGRSEHMSRVVQFLGSGKACSDHLTLLANPKDVDRFAVACADWLGEANRSNCEDRRWNYIELIGGDASDRALWKLCETLEENQYKVSRDPGQPCFAIQMPSNWDEYYAGRSKSTKRQLKKLVATLDGPRVRHEVLTTPEQVKAHWHTFTQLHQRRRCSISEQGCFDHPGFDTFLEVATSRLAARGLVRMYLVYLDDIPIAVSHSLVAGDRLFNYQSGMDPDFAEYMPGFLALVSVLKDMESNHLGELDLLRGDEPYKTRWRAVKTDSVQIRIPCRRRTSILLHQIWRTKATLKTFVLGEHLRGGNE